MCARVESQMRNYVIDDTRRCGNEASEMSEGYNDVRQYKDVINLPCCGVIRY